ncbi:radical SAM protein [Sporanaerobium hydrogeniformans]|uniref:Radical SAM protein n=1 Tax=Sporanaerobium hydrogeniformans TaxID=3072179 RepID=A0AC61DGL2_9FIRM|nr:radical SAM protein [Sporanaerobium hydrogeniformans]PHV72072.1 radical SAM protein [Sporanaerobium hydrogeniformans]
MFEELKACKLCPRGCGVNRLEGQRGFCGAGDKVKLARAALHHWEEPCLSGERGSGAVFFSYCTLGCVYCQNYEISKEGKGKEVDYKALATIFLNLQEQGAHNINLVTPTHYVPQIKEALYLAKDKGLRLPIVYNTSGYETKETLSMLRGLIDIYLPDFKYFKAEYANKYSHAPHYVSFVKEAIEEMLNQVGKPCFDAEGLMLKGVIVRHLLLPGLLFDSKKIVTYLYTTYGSSLYMSLMNQYTPLKNVEKYKELNRPLNPVHYDFIIEYALELGVEKGFIQEGETALESFIPPFNEEGI